jgi:hypothetical protein
MPLGQLRQDYQPIPLPRERADTSVDVSAIEPAPSPALQLQQRLQQSVAPTPDVKKWPAYQSVALIVTVSAALWMALLTAGSQVFQLARPLLS